jgi:hypothetical protein
MEKLVKMEGGNLVGHQNQSLAGTSCQTFRSDRRDQPCLGGGTRPVAKVGRVLWTIEEKLKN